MVFGVLITVFLVTSQKLANTMVDIVVVIININVLEFTCEKYKFHELHFQVLY